MNDYSSMFKSIYKGVEIIFTCKIPVDKHHIKKNSREIHINRATGKRFIGKSKELAMGEAYLTQRLYQEGLKMGIRSPIQDSIIANFLFYFREEDFRFKNGKEKRRDLSNLYQLPEDCLVAAGIIEDDSLIYNHGFSTKLVTPGDSNMLEICLMRFKKEKASDERPVITQSKVKN